MQKQLHILILEDNPADAELMTDALKEAGMALVSKRVETEGAFLKALRDDPPDLILSDYDLPRYNGALALKSAKEHCPDVPFILVTGAVGEVKAIEILTSGATDYVLKSRLERLAQAVRRALAEAQEHQARMSAEDALRKAYRVLEHQFKDAEKKYSIILETVQSGYWMLDMEGKILEANEAYCRMSGYSRDELLRMHIRDLEAAESHEDIVSRIKLIRDRGHDQFESRHRRKDGTIFDVDIRVSYLNVEGGRMAAFSWDITGRKQAEEALRKAKDELESRVQQRTSLLAETNRALMVEIEDRRRIERELRESEEKYRLLFELNVAGVVIASVDPASLEGRLIDCNDAFARILGYSSREERLNADEKDIFHSRADWERLVRRLLQDKKANNYEISLKDKRGKTVWVILNLGLREMERGGRILIEGTMVDITLRKHAENQMQSAHQKLRTMASELILTEERERQHIAKVLHDSVAQILAAIRIRFDSLRYHISSDGERTLAETGELVSQAIRQTRSITSELSPPVLYELGFIPALEWLSEQIETRHGIPVEFECEDGSVELAHDMQVLLFQATRELLANVVQHAKASRVKVSVSKTDGRVKIEVTDDGVGMGKAKLGTHADLTGGYGLFSIRERLRHFGGELTMRSGPGKGTRVVMTAPRGGGRRASKKRKKDE